MKTVKTKVESGQLLNMAQKALDSLFKTIDKFMADAATLQKRGFELKKEEEVEEDGVPGKYYLYEVGDNGQLLEVTLFSIEDNEDSFMIRIEGDGLDKFEKGPIKQKEIEKYVTDYCDKYNLGAIEDSVDAYASNKLSITLQRVAGSSEDTIQLTAINANYNATQALKTLDTVLANDTFVDMITAEPISFEIVEDETDYDVTPVDSVDTSKTFEIILQSVVSTMHNLECIMWGAKGQDMQDLRNFIESLLWDIKYNVDTVAQWCVEYTKVVPNVLTYAYSPIVPPDNGFNFESGLKVAKSLIDEYISVLECYYVNVDHDVQAILDDWIRNLKQKSNYYMDRSLLESKDALVSTL